jgi:outer membrane protein assembly factor BamA
MHQQKFLNFIVLLFILLSGIENSFAQDSKVAKVVDSLPGKKDIIDYIAPFFYKKNAAPGYRELKAADRKFYIALLPSSSGIPGGGTAFITSTNISYYLGDRKTTTLSSINITPYTNFKDRYGISFRSNIWLKNNSWNLLGDFRLLVYPQTSWGLGGNTPKQNETLINYHYSRFYESALKKVAPFLFAGIGINYDHHSHISENGDSSFKASLKPYYDTLPATTYSTGINFTLQYDSRENTSNPEGGYFASAKYRFNPTLFCNTGSWHEWFLDFRKYQTLSKTHHQVLAFWSYWWSVGGTNIPYLDLPSTMWDSYSRSGRGFNQGRYKSDKQIYLEAEYRSDLTENGLLGFVVFSNVQSFSEFKTNQYIYWHPAIGAGLRIKLNKYSKTNIVFDYAMSKEYKTYYINISETF